MEPLSPYSPVMLHLSSGTRILNENPDRIFWFSCNMFDRLWQQKITVNK